jgi:hypothetical protein
MLLLANWHGGKEGFFFVPNILMRQESAKGSGSPEMNSMYTCSKIALWQRIENMNTKYHITKVKPNGFPLWIQITKANFTNY